MFPPVIKAIAELFLIMNEDIPEVELLFFFPYEGVIEDKYLTKSLKNKILSLRQFPEKRITSRM